MEYSGKTSSYHHKWHDTPNSEDEQSGIRKVWFLDAQWSTCPIEVENQVKDLWRFHDLGNDQYIIKTTIAELISDQEEEMTVKKHIQGEGWQDVPLKTDFIVDYARQFGIGDDEQIIIHWWW